MFSCFQIIKVVLIEIRFFLKRDIVIRIFPVNEKPDDPFEEIDDIEKDIQQFLHLSSMNGLVIKCCLFRIIIPTLPVLLSHKQYPENIDCEKSGKWNDIVLNDYHTISMVICSFRVQAGKIYCSKRRV